MSGIFGIFNRDGKPVDKEIVNTMLDATSYWEPDERNLWRESSVALGHAMLWNTPESKYEHLPLVKDALVLTMDARIDNRDELMKELELPDRPIEEIGDSEFILAAYRKWGEECPNYLLGDFAFAIWDDKKKQLFCARDHVGIKQFYYHLSHGLFLFGNDLKVLTQYPNISKEINDEAVANYIVNHQLLSNTSTFFEAFEKLPPAHTLTISNKNMKKHCYWRLEDAPKVKLPNAEAYAKKLRELLEAAVYARMRSDYPITSHLSGGLDSSSIAVLAARKLKEKGQKLLAFNWLHEPEEGDDATQSEWANSKMIAEMEGIEHHYVSLTEEDIYSYMKKRDVTYGETTTFWYEYPILEAVQKRNSRTILTGWGGDELVSYHGQAFYADLFLHGKWIRLYKELSKQSPEAGKNLKTLIKRFYFNVFLPIMPQKVYCCMPKVKCKNDSYTYIKQPISQKVDSEDVKKQLANFNLYSNRTVRSHKLAYWRNSHIQSRIESWNTVSRISKIEYNYPLLDKRLLEFTMGIPSKLFILNGEGRFIFREALKDVLGQEILSIQKITEPQRVLKLIELTLGAFRKITKEIFFYSDKNTFIKSSTIYNAVKKMQNDDMSRESLKMFEEIETAIAILNSKSLE